MFIPCETCPYGIESFLERYSHHGEDYQPDHLYCEKVGGQHWGHGWCNELKPLAYYKRKEKSYRRQYRNNKYNNLILHKNKSVENVAVLNNSEILYDRLNYWNCINEDENGNIYSQISSHSGLRKYAKKQTNKRVRKMDCGDYGAYRKAFNYWCVLF